MAMDLAFGVLCDLLHQWNQVSTGILILMEWLLGGEDLKMELEDSTPVEDEFLFDKGEVNFWAEKLVFVRLISKHLLLLARSCSLGDDEIQRLSGKVSRQGHLVTQLFNGLPPAPQFSKTAEFTRLLIQKERISACRRILELLENGTADGPERPA